MSNTTGIVRGTTARGESAKKANPALTKQELDDLQLLMDLLGFLPGIGIGADLINAAISAIRGNFIGALFDLFSAIPVIGDAGKGAKVVKNIDKYLGVVERLQKSVINKIPNKTIANKLKKALAEAKEELLKQKSSTAQKPKASTGSAPPPNKSNSNKGSGGKVSGKPKLKCGQSGTFKELGKNGGYDGHQRDHIPSKAALLEAAKKLNGGKALLKAQSDAIIDSAHAIAIPAKAHQQASRTYGGRNSTKIQTDAEDLAKAARRDVDTMRKNIGKYNNHCKKEYHKASQKILDKFKTHKDYEKFLEKILKENE